MVDIRWQVSGVKQNFGESYVFKKLAITQTTYSTFCFVLPRRAITTATLRDSGWFFRDSGWVQMK